MKPLTPNEQKQCQAAAQAVLDIFPQFKNISYSFFDNNFRLNGELFPINAYQINVQKEDFKSWLVEYNLNENDVYLLKSLLRSIPAREFFLEKKYEP